MLVVIGDKTNNVLVFRIVCACHDAEIPSTFDLNFRSRKSQMRWANKLGCSFVLFVNSENSLELKNMKTGEQETISLEEFIFE